MSAVMWLKKDDRRYDMAIHTSGFSLDEPTTFANRIHRLIKLGETSLPSTLFFSIDEDEEDVVEELPDLEVVDDAGASTMEEVD
jgi:molecular chaperone HtpG